MTIETSIVSLLSTDSTLTALVASRIYPLLLSEDTKLPAVTYQVISTVTDYSNDGATGLTMTRLQTDAWANSYAQCKAASDAIRHALGAFTGIVSGVYIANVIRDNVTDYFDSASRLYRVQTDWKILHAS